MLLIHPPVSKPCEPPPGLARLCGALHQHAIPYRVWDANLESLLFLLKDPTGTSDRSIERARERVLRRLPRHLADLRCRKGYENLDRYKRAVLDLDCLLRWAGRQRGIRLSLTNYEAEGLSPAKSEDLLWAASHPEENLFFPYFRRGLDSLLEEKEPHLIGFSLNYLSQALTTFAMVGFLRREHPKVPIVLGGSLVTSWMSKPHWRNPFEGCVDHLVKGPGEEVLVSLYGAYVSLRPRGGTGFEGPFLRPRYDGFPIEDYLSPGPILPYSASKGCYWRRCAFCPEKGEGTSFMAVPPQEASACLRSLVMEMKPVLVHLLDNALPPALLVNLASNPPGAPWYGFARLTHPLESFDFCRALRRSGCVMLQLGLESGDQEVLDRMEKGIDLREASLALKHLKKAGIATYVYLLFGTPWEKQESAEKTMAFVVQHQEEIDFLNLALFNLPLFAAESFPVETEPFYEGDLSLYSDFRHPSGWDRKAVRRFLDKVFKRHPAIAPILRREPPFFTSNHAPFFATALRI